MERLTDGTSLVLATGAKLVFSFHLLHAQAQAFHCKAHPRNLDGGFSSVHDCCPQCLCLGNALLVHHSLGFGKLTGAEAGWAGFQSHMTCRGWQGQPLVYCVPRHQPATL